MDNSNFHKRLADNYELVSKVVEELMAQGREAEGQAIVAVMASADVLSTIVQQASKINPSVGLLLLALRGNALSEMRAGTEAILKKQAERAQEKPSG